VGVGGWGPTPQPPTPNPQSPIPNPQFFVYNYITKNKKFIINIYLYYISIIYKTLFLKIKNE